MYEAKGERASHISAVKVRIEDGTVTEFDRDEIAVAPVT